MSRLITRVSLGRLLLSVISVARSSIALLLSIARLLLARVVAIRSPRRWLLSVVLGLS